MIRTILLISWLTFLLDIVSAIFWYNDWIYRLPTPVPADYRHIETGTQIDLSSQIQAYEEKPVFIHFYNPDCACSRFNRKHFQSLVHTYGKSAHFVVVVLSDKKFSQAYIQDKIGLQIPVLFDQSIAKQRGVYATPHAGWKDRSRFRNSSQAY